MNRVNQKIIDAVIEKAKRECPGALALIGVYGSVATGEEYQKSDLDLQILIQDDAGWKLATGFILDDNEVGYDIYCTNWDSLRWDAECHHAQISKLMDSKIVHIENQASYEQLCKLREQAKRILASEERIQRVIELLEKAKVCYANANLQDSLGKVRVEAFGAMYYLMDAVMLFHGKYFKRGTKRMLDELSELPMESIFIEKIMRIVTSKDVIEIRHSLKNLLLYSEGYMRQEKEKQAPSESLSGTYEEMYSNWRNKVEEAARHNNVFASFMNMCNFQYMLSGISSEISIEEFHVMEAYNPDCLEDNVKLFDSCLEQYKKAYKEAGISVKHFSSVDEFAADYLK